MLLVFYYSFCCRMNKTFLAIISSFLVLSCGLNNNNARLSVVLLYDTPVNGYKVSGAFYPFSPTSETGQVELRFVPENGGETLVFSNVNCFEDDNPKYPMKFSDSAILDYVFGDGFSGFHEGDTLICHYDDTRHPIFESPLNYDAGFQFFDVDFDGKDELLINDYYRGKCGNHYTVYENTSSGFVINNAYPFNYITNETEFHPRTWEIHIRADEGKLEKVKVDDIISH